MVVIKEGALLPTPVQHVVLRRTWPKEGVMTGPMSTSGVVTGGVLGQKLAHWMVFQSLGLLHPIREQSWRTFSLLVAMGKTPRDAMTASPNRLSRVQWCGWPVPDNRFDQRPGEEVFTLGLHRRIWALEPWGQ